MRRGSANVGSRLTQFQHYRFAVSSVDVETALHLSRNDTPGEVVQVAWKHPDGGDPGLDKVTPVPLQADRKYYIEAIHESDGGKDHLTIMYRAPGREPEIIPGEFLSPFPTKFVVRIIRVVGSTGRRAVRSDPGLRVPPSTRAAASPRRETEPA